MNETTKEHPTALKIRINEQVPMTKSGFYMWGAKGKIHIAKHMFTYQTRLCTSLSIEILKSDQLIGEWMCQYFGPRADGTAGIYYMMGYSKGKTRTGVKLVALARIEIQDSEERKFRVITTIKGINRLSRYFFRKGTTQVKQ